jgi:diguanylate cyclase
VKHRREETAGSTRRLFLAYAAASLVPVAALGLGLMITLHRSADQDGLAEAKAKADLLANTAIAPQITTTDLADGLPATDVARLRHTVSEAIADGDVSRLRVRNLKAQVVFADDGSGDGDEVDDEALEAAEGHVSASLTRLNDDSNDHGPLGARVVEIYRPIVSPASERQIGVLEVYVPYAPIAAHIASQQRTILLTLAAGLLVLWALLLAISGSVTRRLRRLLGRSRYLATHDQVTGLPNRASFERAVGRALARNDNVAVAVLDLADFGRINDVLGHANGDALLVELARRMSDVLGPVDDQVVARVGGDEYGLLLRAPDLATVAATLTAVREAVAAPVTMDGVPVVVTGSIGYAVSPHDGVTTAALLQRADRAVHVATEHQQPVVQYQAGHESYDASALALVGELSRAIAEDELVLHYQPKGDIGDRRISEVEALVRWQHPTRGLLFPDSFIPLAEGTELIDDLLRWVVRAAVRDLGPFDPLGVAVNVSARSLVRPTLADELLAVLAEADFPATRLIVEITETALMSDPAAAARSLERLHAAGARIAIDDFGAGQTSLGYLAGLPVSELKVDKSFVLPMLEEPRKLAIVRSVVELGHSLGCTVTAEGVETEEILDRLDSMRCDLAQGYLLARPVPLDRLADALAGAAAVLAPVVVAAG